MSGVRRTNRSAPACLNAQRLTSSSTARATRRHPRGRVHGRMRAAQPVSPARDPRVPRHPRRTSRRKYQRAASAVVDSDDEVRHERLDVDAVLPWTEQQGRRCRPRTTLRCMQDPRRPMLARSRSGVHGSSSASVPGGRSPATAYTTSWDTGNIQEPRSPVKRSGSRNSRSSFRRLRREVPAAVPLARRRKLSWQASPSQTVDLSTYRAHRGPTSATCWGTRSFEGPRT